MRNLDIRVVLVRTIYERNIGSSSRAMSNMGATQLILIDPKCKITYEAQKAAATGQDGLQSRKTYESWSDFNSSEPNDSLRIAFTARDGKGRLAVPFLDCLNDIKKTDVRFRRESDEPRVIHLIFGPEDWGLNGDDLKDCHYSCTIPTYGKNSSLNLAQAVLMGLYLLRQELGGELTVLDGQQVHRRKQKIQSDIFPDQTLKDWLTEMGFDLSKRRINVYTVLKRMILQNVPTTKEYRLLEIVLQQSLRKLKELNHLRKDSREKVIDEK